MSVITGGTNGKVFGNQGKSWEHHNFRELLCREGHTANSPVGNKCEWH